MNNAAAPPAEPAPGASFVRPRFLLPAAATFAGFAILLQAGALLPPTYFLTPAFVLGCRYFELARYEAVHRSGWLLLMITGCVGIAVPGIHSWIQIGQVPWLPIVFAVLLLVSGCHLFVMQRGVLKERTEHGFQDRSRPCADWACGGLLAMFPPMFLLGVRDSLATWRDPFWCLFLSLSVVLLVLQLLRNRWFPLLTLVCFLVSSGATIYEWSTPSRAFDAGDLLQSCLPTLLLAVYLSLAPRVRRTFRT